MECFFTCAYSTAGGSSIKSMERLRFSGMSMCCVDFCFTKTSVTVQFVDRVGLIGNALVTGVDTTGVCFTGLVGT